MRRAWLVILLVAAALRLYGLGFGLEPGDVRRSVLNSQTDECGMVISLRTGLLRGDLHPGDFLHRGSGAYYLFGLVDGAVLGAQAALHDEGWSGVMAEQDADPWLLHLLHRLLAALAGETTVWVLMRLCRRALGEREALLAGALLACSYVHVRESHFGTVDALFGLFIVISLDRMLAFLADPTPRRYAAAGLWAGATTAVKYFGGVLGGHLIAGHVLARGLARREGRAPPPPRRLGLALGMTAVGFGLLSIYLVFAAGDLADVLLWSNDHFGPLGSWPRFWSKLQHQLRYTLFVGCGELVLPAGLAGLVLGWRRGGGARFLALSFLLMTPCVLWIRSPSPRFGLPLAILIVPCAALALQALLARLPRAAGAFVLAAVLLPPILRSASFDLLVAEPDTRGEMVAALDALGAPRREVLAFGLHGLPSLHDGEPKPFVDFYRRVYVAATFTEEELLGRRPRYILRDLSSGLAPEGEDWERRVLEPILAAEYRELLRLDGRVDSEGELPDPTAGGSPTFMVPFDRPWSMTRPGPPLVLYERVTRDPSPERPER